MILHHVIALEIVDDHIHVFVQCDPKHSPADIARQFKSYSGKHLLKRYPEIRESYFWRGGFWKIGYYGGTTDAVSEEVVERYIEEIEHAPE
ncbi:IS200-type transposase [Natrinema versiforme JCM 10478]|uniref:IS200-type transposase n=1 Tax=Natrinema versiforme JCM 10478 TaxID=1227496 RepID=L9XML7_9EURY|nr:IS200-type transposase [Natrinema versiforme JCM 10478]